MKIFISTPLVTERLGNKLWKLREDFVVYIDSVPVVVPAGFITDGASAPQLAWSFCAPMAGPWGEAGVIHDYLYSLVGPEVSKEYADNVLSEVGLHRGANKFHAFLAWLGVHLYGHRFFKVESAKVKSEDYYNYTNDKDKSNDLQIW